MRAALQREDLMARYVLLINWTDQGIRNAKDTINRANAARQAFQAGGGQVLDIYWTVGPYDIVAIFEAPDEETATRLILALGMQGSIRTTTMRAFGEQEMGRITQGLPFVSTSGFAGHPELVGSVTKFRDNGGLGFPNT